MAAAANMISAKSGDLPALRVSNDPSDAPTTNLSLLAKRDSPEREVSDRDRKLERL